MYILIMLGLNIFIETVYNFSDHTMERYHPYQRAPWNASIFKKIIIMLKSLHTLKYLTQQIMQTSK